MSGTSLTGAGKQRHVFKLAQIDGDVEMPLRQATQQRVLQLRLKQTESSGMDGGRNGEQDAGNDHLDQ